MPPHLPVRSAERFLNGRSHRSDRWGLGIWHLSVAVAPRGKVLFFANCSGHDVCVLILAAKFNQGGLWTSHERNDLSRNPAIEQRPLKPQRREEHSAAKPQRNRAGRQKHGGQKNEVKPHFSVLHFLVFMSSCTPSTLQQTCSQLANNLDYCSAEKGQS